MEKTVLPPTTPPSADATFATHRVLLLNADFQPLGFPLLRNSVLGSEQTVKDLFEGRIRVIKPSDVVAHAPNVDFPLPSVVALTEYAPRQNPHRNRPKCGLESLYVRDMGMCMYSPEGKRLKLRTPERENRATMDHIRPVSKGGDTAWENCMLASCRQNGRKGNKSLADFGQAPLNTAWSPREAELLSCWLIAHWHDDALIPAAWREFLWPFIKQPSRHVQQTLERLAPAMNKAAVPFTTPEAV